MSDRRLKFAEQLELTQAHRWELEMYRMKVTADRNEVSSSVPGTGRRPTHGAKLVCLVRVEPEAHVNFTRMRCELCGWTN